jgi:hypothetical protein
VTPPTVSILAQLLWQSPGMLPVAAAVAAVAVAAVLWLYPPQVHSLKRPWRWTMPALRVLALAALAVCLLRPAALRTRTVEEHGAVVVLLDRSASMGVVDAGRTPAERVALAAGLGALPAGVRDERARTARARADELARLADEARRARRELDYAALAGRNVATATERLAAVTARLKAAALPLAAVAPLAGVAEQVAKLAPAPDDAAVAALAAALAAARDALAAEQVRADDALYHANGPVRRACDDAASLSRAALAATALARPDGVLARLPPGTPVFGYTFDAGLQPLQAVAELAEPHARAATTTTTAPSSLPVVPAGDATDIAAALRGVYDRFHGRPIQAVLLCTDGRQVTRSERDSVEAPSAAVPVVPGGAPVFAIDVAGPVRKDVSITRVNVPANAFPGEPLVVRADVRGRGLKGQAVDVRLEAAWAEAPQVQRVMFGRDDETATVSFPAGAVEGRVYRAAVEVPPIDGEATAANNRVQRYVKVVSDKLAVTALSGAPTWDFRYLRNALARTPWVTLGTAGGAPPAPERILQQSVVILSDVRATDLSAAQREALLDLVTQRGGSVLLLAGDPDVLRGYEADPALAGLLPYRSGLEASWRVWPGDQPAFRPVPAGGTEASPLAGTWGGGPRESLERWLQLPALFRYLALPELKPGTRVLLSERDSGAPILTETPSGAGRVLFLAVNETWRWRRGAGERDHDRFWLQLLRHAAGESYAAEAGGLALDVDPVATPAGRGVTVRARARGPDGGARRASDLRLRVTRDGGGTLVADVPLRAIDAGAAGRYEAVVRDLPGPGTYEVRLTDAAAPDRSVAVPLHVDPGLADDAELADVSGAPDVLRRLAEASGGAYLPVERLGDLAGYLSDVRGRQSETIEYPLWDSPYLFAFVLACLGGEWALRKRFGLA